MHRTSTLSCSASTSALLMIAVETTQFPLNSGAERKGCMSFELDIRSRVAQYHNLGAGFMPGLSAFALADEVGTLLMQIWVSWCEQSLSCHEHASDVAEHCA